MSMITYSSLFIERSVCILYTATTFERGSAIGWIGGTAPMFFDTPQSSSGFDHYTSHFPKSAESRNVYLGIPTQGL